MGTFLKKLIPNNIAGIIGIIQVIVPLVREIVIATIRIVDVLTPDNGLLPLIEKVGTIAMHIEDAIVKFKNMFLGG